MKLRPEERLGCSFLIGWLLMVVVAIVVNLVLLAGAVWVIVYMLRYMGVIV